ncbi:MAG: Uma2 family endonuclease [Selenomonadaceae bacterium]|nr:Uma2 family endonuclease [Selenomonadaceae bacterium]
MLAQVMEEEQEYELIDGQEVRMFAASIPHTNIQVNLCTIIRNFLKGKHCKVFVEPRVVFDDKSWFQPDLAVVCDRRKIKLNCIQGAPDFVVEILSPTTASRDFGVKKDKYEASGVKEYWIIDPKAENIMVYLLQDGKYVLDNVYHRFTEEEWEGLDAAQKEAQQQKMSLKISLYDDLLIEVAEVFED